MARNDFLSTMREKYSYERETPQEQNQADLGAFKRFGDYVAQNNSQDLWEWVGKQDEVIKAKDMMMTTFSFYMFETLKPQFVAFCKDNSLDVIENYVNASIEASKGYVSPSVELEQKINNMEEIIRQQALIIEQQKTVKEVVKI